ncbi:ATP-binding cassette domain-containing protein [Streptomyces sp. UMAF16]|nr:ATP-binding cassette domain-containing protein [Streptomyces sp. UMAF16]
MTGLRKYLAGRARTWGAVVRLAPRGGTVALVQSLAINVSIAVLPTAFVVSMGVLLNRIARLDGRFDWSTGADQLLVPFAIAIAVFVTQQMLLPLQLAYGEIITRRVDAYCIQRLMRAASMDADMVALERPETLDVLNDARAALDRDLPTPGDAVAGALALLARYGQLIGALVLVGVVLSPVAAVVLAVTALTLRFGQRGSLGRLSRLWYSLAATRRGLAYVRRLGSGPAAAKEIRVLGLLRWVRELHQRQADAYYNPLWRQRWKISFRPFLAYAAIGLVGTAVVMRWLASGAAHGDITMLDFAIAVQAVLIPIRFAAFFPECDVQTQYGLEGYEAMVRFEEMAAANARDRGEDAAEVVAGKAAAAVRDQAAANPAGRPAGAGKAAAPAPVGTVRFEDVRFRYTPDGRDVLRGLDLELRPGTSTAIVGLNGAGKTTLVKLLTKLYEPTSGRITVDGESLSGAPTRAWQRRLAVIFQDYVRYELSARDNIRMGAPWVPDAAIEPAAKRAGAVSVLDRLPAGPDTVLCASYADGQNLSGGQWQRVALARAFHAVEHGASLLVLDEPTAQLDVRAEVEFFDRFIDVTEGVTSVIISHRFSTVRRADQIVVIESGRVAERGSHDELSALGGRYAELFRLQAQRFEELAS